MAAAIKHLESRLTFLEPARIQRINGRGCDSVTFNVVTQHGSVEKWQRRRNTK